MKPIKNNPKLLKKQTAFNVGGNQKGPKFNAKLHNNTKDIINENIAEGNDLNDDDLESLNDNIMNKGPVYSPEQLNQDVPSKNYESLDPQAPRNLAFYHFKGRAYKKEEMLNQEMILHFSYEGDIIHKEGPEMKTHEEIQEIRSNAINEAKKAALQEDPSVKSELETAQGLKTLKKTLRNKFNYNERQQQTINEIIKEKGMSTEPPPSVNFSFGVDQWSIYDAYQAQERQQEGDQNKENEANEKVEKQEGSLYSVSFKKCLKIMERMVVNNEQQQRYRDYKYYWQERIQFDSGKSTEGFVLPLWLFLYEKNKRKNVTALCWNPHYKDLFAVSYGSYDFMKPKTGSICLFSLKNTTHPEYIFNTESGVLCLDFHPKSPALLCAGLYDGTVLVYDIRNKHKKPIYVSTVRTSKHTDPVWQINWNQDISKNFNFYSVSSDGRVTNWVLMKNKLEAEDVIKLKLTGKNDEEESNLIGLACGICFDFNKFEPHLFLVGTEEGKIHLCSRAYSGQYQKTYKGHLLAVYKVRWNQNHDRTFISASADWTVKIWDYKYDYPIMSFDLGTQVVDAVWAPYSSTVFATATLEKLFVYDLSVDKHGRLVEIGISKHKLTNVSFSLKEPIILVGDIQGCVTLATLSPNLCNGIDGKLPSDQPEGTTFEQFQQNKMETLLSLVGKFDKEDS